MLSVASVRSYIWCMQCDQTALILDLDFRRSMSLVVYFQTHQDVERFEGRLSQIIRKYSNQGEPFSNMVI